MAIAKYEVIKHRTHLQNAKVGHSKNPSCKSAVGRKNERQDAMNPPLKTKGGAPAKPNGLAQKDSEKRRWPKASALK
jgi:hypothetical protein